MSKILDLSNLQPNQIIKVVIPKGKKWYSEKPYFCIVKTSVQIPKKNLIKEFTYERHKKVMQEQKYAFSSLHLIEFNAQSSPWSMTVPTKTTHTFTSLADTDYEFSLESSSLEELKLALLQGENTEIANAYDEVSKKVEKIKQGYIDIFNNAWLKLVVE